MCLCLCMYLCLREFRDGSNIYPKGRRQIRKSQNNSTCIHSALVGKKSLYFLTSFPRETHKRVKQRNLKDKHYISMHSNAERCTFKKSTTLRRVFSGDVVYRKLIQYPRSSSRHPSPLMRRDSFLFFSLSFDMQLFFIFFVIIFFAFSLLLFFFLSLSLKCH